MYEIKYIASRFINRSMKQFSIGEFKYKVNNFIEWKDKIKAKKIEELDEVLKGQLIEKIRVYFEAQKEVLQSLLEERN